MRSKRVLLLGAAVGIASLALAVPAHAVRPGASKRVAEVSAPITATANGTVVKSTRGAHVHAISLVCPTAPCEVALFDSATADDSGNAVWEGRVATNNDTYTQEFAVPLVTSSGLNVQVSGDGTAFVAFE